MCALSCTPAAVASPPSMAFEDVVGAAVSDLCDRQIVLLGEAADHGRGQTLALKSEITGALIEQCGFDVLLFESSFYDFARLYGDVQAGASASDALIASSIGGIWNQYGEVQALLPELTEAYNAGSLVVGGLDHNLGSAGAFYSIEAMPADLASLLEPDARQACQDELRRLIYFDYGREGPTSARIAPVLTCLNRMEEPLDASQQVTLEAAIQRQLLVNARRYAEAMSGTIEVRIQAREQAFVDNLQWWQAQLPPESKIIVWGASVHFAKSSSHLDRFAGVETAGAMIVEAFGEQAHVLSFAAVGGSYRFLNRPAQSLPDPVSGSVEALFADTQGFRYLDRAAVEALGSRPAALLTSTPIEAQISAVTDSLIVIEQERPPTFAAP